MMIILKRQEKTDLKNTKDPVMGVAVPKLLPPP